MCGIAGFFTANGACGREADSMSKAVSSLAHRGPDDQGVWFSEDGATGLGHRRLSIIDLSEHGHQPMASACGQWMMVFNGEVYNFSEIRAELEPLGHRFGGTGDSEVILAAFAQWGPDAAKRFIGMFAIGLWHRATRTMHLLRDRLGVKPLYYRWDGRTLLFGSELKALRAFDTWAPEIDRDALNDYLRYGYIDDPRTIYRSVYKLPPAHRLVLRAGGDVELHRYWNVLENRRSLAGRSETALADELEALMIDAFRYRMIADVPVGVFLSGGIDSSIVAAILQKHGGQQIKTYTIGFDDPAYDESAHAERVAQHIGTEHHSRVLKVSDAKALLPRWGDLFDEPFADESGIPTLLVSKMAAEEVKVVLSADGGDELFSGYNNHTTTLQRAARFGALPQGLRQVAASAIRGAGLQQIDGWLASSSAPSAQQFRASFLSRVVANGERLAARSLGELYRDAHGLFRDDEIDGLIGQARETRELADAYPGSDGEKMCLWDMHHYMSADVLTKVDRATMAVSIEGREPMIDHRLVEFAFSLPFEMRRDATGGKRLLKQVLYRYVPRELVDRPKRGFGIPVKQWLAEDLGYLLDDYLDPDVIRRQGLFDPDRVQHYVRRLRAGDVGVRRRVWSLLAFQMWWRRWMHAS